MKKSKLTALILAAALAASSAVGCSVHSKSNSNGSSSADSGYAGISGVAVDQSTIEIGEEANANNTSYTLNRVIDSGMVKDGLKYIYLDVTIKNTSAEDYEANALNNFYVKLEDGTEEIPNIAADNYGKKSIEGYEHLSEISANSEFNGYIGFCLDESVTSFTVGFFATGTDINDKSIAIYCDVSEDDIISAPDGFIKAE